MQSPRIATGASPAQSAQGVGRFGTRDRKRNTRALVRFLQITCTYNILDDIAFQQEQEYSYYPLVGFNETMITYLLAIASPTHSVPPSMYYSGWASQSERAVRYRRGWGQTTDGDHYGNGRAYYGITLPVGVGVGGPLFFTHYSFMGFDPHALTTDRDLLYSPRPVYGKVKAGDQLFSLRDQAITIYDHNRLQERPPPPPEGPQEEDARAA